MKVAVTVRAWLMVTVQVPVPEQPSPLQPAKFEPALAVAVSVTLVPVANVFEQALVQLMPIGLLVTVPLPAPERLTVSVWKVVWALKVAVTVRAWLMVTVQVPAPVQFSPLQPAKLEPALAVALSVTLVPVANVLEQAAVQLMPVGLLVTVPPPAPARLTVSD